MTRLITPTLFKALAICVVLGILYGVVPTGQLVIALGAFILIRVLALISEAVRRVPGASELEERRRTALAYYQALNEDDRLQECLNRSRELTTTPEELAWMDVEEIRRNVKPRRPLKVILAEGIGLLSFGILLPFLLALHTREFVTVQRNRDWVEALVVVGCVMLYAWPHLWSEGRQSQQRRLFWWALPFPPLLGMVVFSILQDHAYLNPLDPEHKRLAAERVLSLTDGIVAAEQSDVVQDYAEELDAAGNQDEAVRMAREALRLNAENDRAYGLIVAHDPEFKKVYVGTKAVKNPPYWEPGEVLPPLRSCHIDSRLNDIEGVTVIIIRIGEVPESLTTAVGYVIGKETGLPVWLSDTVVPLPPHTRRRGLLGGEQWDLSVMFPAFQRTIKDSPKAPLKLLMVTAADIYSGASNYIFSGAYDFGGVVSYAQYLNQKDGEERLRFRLAKQSLGCIIKSFGIPISPDRACVTSYTRSVPEFDRKGNRPNEVTRMALQRLIANAENQWQLAKSLRR